MDSTQMIELIADIIEDERFELIDSCVSWKEAKRVATLILEALEAKEVLR